jgi:hypothetical protein
MLLLWTSLTNEEIPCAQRIFIAQAVRNILKPLYQL